MLTQSDPAAVPAVVPRRKITSASAILLPFHADGSIDWAGLRDHVARTAAAGITPAVNMDTGYVHLIDQAQRERVLRETRSILGGGAFIAGTFVADAPGAPFAADAYARQIELVQAHGGTPIIFQSYGLTESDPIGAYQRIAAYAERFIGFELGTMFAPFGKIYDLDTYAALMDIPQCIGAKHSSLSRVEEWQRLRLRDQRRPDFKVFTGNDLAIDMVIYGSDYLLGLSTFAPDAFARRDALWEQDAPEFFELNDLLQYLGFLAFRAPVPAYRHSAAQFLKLRGWIASDQPHPAAPRRPDSDIALLRDILERLAP